jgi:hypothetical protein
MDAVLKPLAANAEKTKALQVALRRLKSSSAKAPS